MQTFREATPFRKVFVCFQRAYHLRLAVYKCALIKKGFSPFRVEKLAPTGD